MRKTPDDPPPEFQDAARGFLDDPFADWGNDDLNFKPPAPLGSYRDALQEVFAWSELRAMFDAHQAAAAPARRRSRRWGIVAVWLGVTGICTASFAPLILLLVTNWATAIQQDPLAASRPYEIGLGVVILAAALASGLIGYGAILRGQAKGRWLLNRFWCERLRQLHFQIIVSSLPLIAEALTDPAAMDRYKALRREYLNLFRQDFLSTAKDRLDALEKDVAENEPWVLPIWEAPGRRPVKSSALEALLTVFVHQRFGIQKRFCEKKLAPGWHSPRTRAHFVTNASNLLTGVLLLLSVATAFNYLILPNHLVLLLSLAGFAGAIGALIAAMRVFNEGLQFGADTERYNWYLATVQAHERRFRKAALGEKLEVLRDMEVTAYQEMRRFIVAVSHSKFVM